MEAATEMVVSCDICMEGFNEQTKTPLILPCGHTFCRQCLLSISNRSPGSIRCPKCTKTHGVQIAALTVNYSLLTLTLPPPCDPQFEECNTHRDQMKYWCCTCALSLCTLCLHSGHPQQHNVKKIQVFVQEEKTELVQKIKTLSGTLQDKKKNLEIDFGKLDITMKDLFRRNAKLQSISTELDDLLNKTKIANGMSSVNTLKKAVHDLKLGEKFELEAASKKLEEEAIANLQANYNQAQHCETTSTESRCAMMDFQDGRLLLHSYTSPQPPMLSLQMPSEVFIELSIGKRCLGNLYIKLWTSMRLAQQFLALCSGMVGPSLLGFTASKIPLSKILFQSSAASSNNQGNTPILTNLELSGNYKKIEEEGYVMWIPQNNRLGFAICTEGYKQATIGSFGEVSFGLDIAKEALKHEPLSEITITHCGLVLPNYCRYTPSPPTRSLRREDTEMERLVRRIALARLHARQNRHHARVATLNTILFP